MQSNDELFLLKLRQKSFWGASATMGQLMAEAEDLGRESVVARLRSIAGVQEWDADPECLRIGGKVYCYVDGKLVLKGVVDGR